MKKFLYIDDDKNSSKMITGFESNELVIKTCQHESSWESQLEKIESEESDFDGMILDLRLDDMPNVEGYRANFRGTALAQEIRTRQKENNMKCFPIVLYSANDKVQSSLEQSGKDLFDICIDKSIDYESLDMYKHQLLALANGYRELNETDNNTKLLQIDTLAVDSRFISSLNSLQKLPVHVQARFIIMELLEKQGLLINEDVLAARLGIDKDNSVDWNLLKQQIIDTQYTGVFAEGWKRWWMFKIEDWWEYTIGMNSSLRSTPASKRVEYIRDRLNIDRLNVAQKIEKSDSEEFWTVCQGYNRPLDPIDGLLIRGQENLYPWQEPEYVSIDAALRRKNISKWESIADIEKENFEELKSRFEIKKSIL